MMHMETKEPMNNFVLMTNFPPIREWGYVQDIQHITVSIIPTFCTDPTCEMVYRFKFLFILRQVKLVNSSCIFKMHRPMYQCCFRVSISVKFVDNLLLGFRTKCRYVLTRCPGTCRNTLSLGVGHWLITKLAWWSPSYKSQACTCRNYSNTNNLT